MAFVNWFDYKGVPFDMTPGEKKVLGFVIIFQLVLVSIFGVSCL